MKVEVTRNSDDGVETLGKLVVLNDSDAVVFSCDTLELPDKDNASQVSCIPKGTYICEKVGVSHIPYPHISITNVANREGICIHCGNFHTDVLGCIITGSAYSDINGDGEPDLVNSKDTFNKLMAILPQQFNLTIK